MPDSPRVAGPVLLMIAGLLAAVVFSFGYTSWAIGYHGRQACAELRILATAPGADTRYDKAVREQFGHLYELRCRLWPAT